MVLKVIVSKKEWNVDLKEISLPNVTVNIVSGGGCCACDASACSFSAGGKTPINPQRKRQLRGKGEGGYELAHPVLKHSVCRHLEPC
jgi:hypothetical protein